MQTRHTTITRHNAKGDLHFGKKKKKIATDLQQERVLRSCIYLLPFFLLLLTSNTLFSRQLFVSPTGSDASGNGSIGNPYFSLNKVWSYVVPGDTVYMRNGTYAYSVRQNLDGKSGTATNYIKLWAYPNEVPVLTRTSTYYSSGATIGIYLRGNYLHLKNLEIKGFDQIATLSGNLVAGLWVTNASYCIFEGLRIHDNGMGMRVSDNSGHNRVINSDFYCNQDPYTTIGAYENADGLQIAFLTGAANADTSWITNCRFWWNTDDGFDCYNNDGVVIIENCWAFWNGYVPNTFNPGAGGNGYKLGPTTIGYPTLIKRKIYKTFAYANRRNGYHQNLARCKFEYYNNTAYLNGWKGFAMADDPSSENLAHIFKNNIGYQNGTYNAYISPASTLLNNTFLHTGGVNTSYNVTDADFSSVTSTGIDGPRPSDNSLPELTFLHLAAGSDLIDGGVNVGLPYSGSAPDLGLYEYIVSGGNQAPVIANQTFQVPENSANGTIVGTIVASDPDAGQSLTYSILSGNTNSAFSIQSTTGVLSVANSTALNFEATPSFALIVKVQDNGSGNLSNQATITVNLTNQNEAPTISNQTFSINENSVNGTTVGTVTATDPDAGQVLTYSILSGNTSGAFTINASTGVLYVANSAAVNFESIPAFSLVVKVQDNGTGNLSNQATMTVNILNVNETPVIANQSFSVNENTTNGTTVATVIASDPDAGQVLTYTILSGNTSGAFAINSSTGVLTVANSSVLNFETTPIFSLVVKVQDNGTGSLSSQATITISLLNINEVPLISNQTFSTAENSANGTAVGTVIASDPDAGQVLTFSILSGNTSGAFAINTASGAITVANSAALNFETTPTFSLVVKVQDNGSGTLSSQATITINLTNVNEIPIISNQSFSVVENAANGTNVGTVVASDPDAGQVLTYSILSGNTSGAFAINASTAVITVANYAALNFESIPTFTLVVKAQDNGTGSLSSQATITINITDQNESPIIANQSFTVNENAANGTFVGTVVANDPDAGQTLTYSILSGNTSGAFAINSTSGALTVGNTAVLNFESIPAFSLVIKAQDNGTGALSAQATITISLVNVNEAPVIGNQSFNVAENSANGTIVGTVVANDPDAGQTLTYSILSGNTSGAFAINASTASITVANSSVLNFELNPVYILVVKVQDNGTGTLSNQANITINLSDANEAPIINNQSFSITENTSNGTTVGTVIASDPDAGQTLTYSILSGNTSGAFAINALSGLLTVANSAALNFESTPGFSLAVSVVDNGATALSNQATITISITDINEAPVISNQTFSLTENSANGTTVGTVVATDPDAGQSLTYSILSGNTSNAFVINGSTGVIAVSNSAALNYESNPTFALIIKVQDNASSSLSSQATITINLTNVNEAPIISNQSFSIAENSANGTNVGTVIASDPDAGQLLTYSIQSGNTSSAFAINPTTGIISVANSTALNYESNPTFSLVIKVQDNGSGSLSSQATVTISVTNINEPPVINNQSFVISENSPNGTNVGTISATDPDAGQTLSFSILSGNSSGAFTINATSGAINVANSSALNFESTPSFALIVKAQDNGTGNLSSQATVTINLSDINEVPSIANQAFSVSENATNGSSIGIVIASDPDAGQTLSYSILSGNTSSVFAINSGTGLLTVANASALNFETTPTYTLLVKVQDNGTGALSNQANITISVTDANDAPLISNQTFTLNENVANGTNVGTVIATDPDAGQTLTYSILSGNSGGAYSINSTTGLLTVANSSAINFEANPTFALIVKVQDNGSVSLSSQATVTVNLVNLNESPVISNQSFTIAENSSNGTSIGNVIASDPDAGQVLTYTIVSGNTSGAFAINSVSGNLTVLNSTALNYETTPTYSLIVQVADNGTGNLSSQATVTIHLTNVNEIPVISNQSFSIAENSANGTSVGVVIATDPDIGQSLTYYILSGNSSDAFNINSINGHLTVANSAALNFEVSPVFTLVIKVQDNGAGLLSNQATITINLTDVNDAPIIGNQTFSVAENASNGTSIGTIIATDPDAGQILSYSILSGNTSGVFALNSTTGLLTVGNSTMLNFESTPSYALLVKVQDNGTGSLSSQAIVTINLTDANEAPVIANQSFSIAENSPNGSLTGMVTATDPDAGQTLTYSILSGNTAGAFAINASNGSITVSNSPALNYEATSTFYLVVKVQDNGSGNLSSQATVTIHITDVNDQPVVNDQAFAVAENAAVASSVGIVVASDEDAGQVLIYSITAGNTDNAFSIHPSSGLISVANSAALDFEINPSFTLTVNVQDNATSSLADQAYITINVQNGNEPPQILPQNYSTLEHQPIGTSVGNVVASDPDLGQTISFAITAGNNGNGFAINPVTGELSINNPAAVCFEGNPQFTLTIQVTDILNLTNNSTVTVDIQDINENPVCQTQAFNINENELNGSTVGTVIASDPDFNQNLTFTITAGNTGNAFAIDPTSGLLTVSNASALDFETTSSFTLTVNVQDDGQGSLSTTSQVTITLVDVNEAPVVNNQAFDVTEFAPTGTFVGFVVADDPDAGQNLNFSITGSSPAEAFQIDPATGEITVTNPALLDSFINPLFTISIQVTDNGSGNLSDIADITIHVLQGPNLAPVIANQSFTIAENTAFGTMVGNVIASDPNSGQVISYSIIAGNTNAAFSIDPASGTITVNNTAALNFETSPVFELVIAVQDNGTISLSSQATITITLSDVNEIPQIGNQTFTLNENSPNGTLVGNVVASDPDAGQILTYSIIAGNISGAFAINPATGAITVANSAVIDFETHPVFSLTVKAQDNGTSNLSNQAIVTINLNNSNEAPVIANQSFSIAENSPNGSPAGTVTATDPDAGQTLTYSILSGNTAGVFAINSSTGGIIVANSVFLNHENYPVYTLIIKVQDNGTGNLSSQAAVTISVLDINESPVITNQELSVQQNAAVGTHVGNVLAFDPDAGQFLTYSILSGNTDNAFLLDPLSGELTVGNSAALDFGTNPMFNLNIKVTDNNAIPLSSTAEVNVYVLEELNNPPLINDQSFTINENSNSGTFVGQVIASDPDAGQFLTYSIISGNILNAFSIDQTTGSLSVNNTLAMDFETYPIFELQVQVTDNGFGSLFNHAMISIHLNDVNESPSAPVQIFAMTENSGNGTIIGLIEATDPDFGQTLTFTILSGNPGGAFAIDALSGYISVADENAIDYEADSLIQIEVKVEDNGDGNLYDIVIDSIYITDINETPFIEDQLFNIAEDAPVGTNIGNIVAGDPDQGQSVTYSIISGNDGNVFQVDPQSGNLSLLNNQLLNFEVQPTYELLVQVMDNSPENLLSQAIMTITVTDQNESPILDSESFTINENTPGGYLIGTLIANDPDQGQVLTYSIISGNTNTAFSLNSASGVLTVANASALDFETNNNFVLMVMVSDDGVSPLSDTASITITLNDLNETPIITDQTFNIEEFSANGSSVGFVSASDPDLGQGITFSILAGNTGDAFMINPTTGELNVNNSAVLNYLVNPLFTLLIQVTDNGLPVLSGQATITIQLMPSENFPPVITNQFFVIAENSANGTNIGTVTASDPNQGQILTYSIISGNLFGAFSINSATGVLSVSNFMALNYEVNPVFNLTVQVIDNGLVPLSSSALVEVSLSNVNENPAISNQSFSVAENSANGTWVGQVLANDPDFGEIINYQIVNGNTSNAFILNADNGNLIVGNSAALDYEINSIFSLDIQVTDDEGLASTAIVTIELDDVNESPVISNQEFILAENSPNGTVAGVVLATDPDQGQQLSYAIIAGNELSAFMIDPLFGILSVANSNALDFEMTSVFTLTIAVEDNGTGNLGDQATVVVNLSDINESPVIDDYQFSIEEFAANGTLVGTVTGNDQDAGQILTYSIESGNTDNAFSIHPLSGEIVVVNSDVLDTQVNPQFNLVVKATDNGTPALYDDAQVIITLIPDLNEPPVILNQAFQVEENSAQGTLVGIVAANDPNPGQIISFAITAGNNNSAFSINSVTGALYVNNTQALDFENQQLYNLWVTVTDDEGLSSQAIIEVNILDTNESPVIEPQSFEVEENASSQTKVGIVTAHDQDAGQVLSYTILSGNTDNAFSIDALSGEIAVANSAALNAELIPQYQLLIGVNDNAQTPLFSQAIVTIHVMDLNEPPAILDKYFLIAENSANGSMVGKVRTVDPDSGQILRYLIVSGNIDNAFAIDMYTGILTVTNSSALNYEAIQAFDLMVRVSDNGQAPLSTQSVVTIELDDVNEWPFLSNYQFDLPEGSPAGTYIGTIAGMEQDSGQYLSYSIISGNYDSTFTLNPLSGDLIVNDNALLDYSVKPVFTLGITATDNSAESLSVTAYVKIRLIQSAMSKIVYIDPTHVDDPEEKGTILHPFDSWNDVIITDGYTYLQKRGTLAELTKAITLFNAVNVKMDAYGEGLLPVLRCTVPQSKIVNIENSNNIVIRNLHITSDGTAGSCIYIDGHEAAMVSIDSCELNAADYGILSNSHMIDLHITNNQLSALKRDGIVINEFASVVILNNQIQGINMTWLENQDSEGDGIRLYSDEGLISLRNNMIDNSATGNSACIRVSGSSYHCITEHNTLIAGSGPGNSCIWMNNTDGEVITRYNSLKGGDYGLNSFSETQEVYYNLFTDNTISIKVQKNKKMSLINNTLVNTVDCFIETLDGTLVTVENNIFSSEHPQTVVYRLAGSIQSDNNLFNAENAGYLNGYSTLSAWIGNSGQDMNSRITDPLFRDIHMEDFRLQDGSAAINAGKETAYLLDYFGNEVPQHGLTDIGYFESSAQLLDSEKDSTGFKNTLIVKVFPNPATDYIRINFEEKVEDISVRLMDERGVDLIHKEAHATREVRLDINHLSAGVYFIIINANEQLISRKVIKQ
jgi:hypothetical protein